MTYDFREASDEFERHIWLCSDCENAVKGGNLSRLSPDRLQAVRRGVYRLPLKRMISLADHGSSLNILRDSAVPCESCGSNERGTKYLYGVARPRSWARREEEVSEPVDEPYQAPKMSRYNGKCKTCNRFHTALLKKTHNVRVEGKTYPGYITDENEILSSFGTDSSGHGSLGLVVRDYECSVRRGRGPGHERTAAPAPAGRGKQVLQTGTGALNIDACRVATTNTLGGGRLKGPTDMSKACGGPEWDRPWMHNQERRAQYAEETAKKVAKAEAIGRWPANVVLSHTASCGDVCSEDCVVQQLDEQSGECGGAPGARVTKARTNLAKGQEYDRVSYGYDEPRSGASRFFYTSKVAPSERKLPDGTTNKHPTLKSIKLMRYLVRLVTPPNGIVLDPFAGSGTTGVAAMKEGCSFVGVELDPEHHRVAQLRLVEAEGSGSVLDDIHALAQE